MSLVGLLERGYTMIWREGRLEDALRGRAVRMEMFHDLDDARRAAGL
jgi:hypothetical protein